MDANATRGPIRTWGRAGLRPATGLLAVVVVGLLTLAALGGRAEGAQGKAQDEGGQAAAGTQERSITTVGYGQASVPAETVAMQFVVSTQEAYGSPFPRLSPNDTLGDAERAAAEPIVQAIVDAGVPEDAIEVLTSPALGSGFGPQGGRGIYRLDFTVEGPDLTLERLNGIVNAAGQATAVEGQILGFVGARYLVADCGPVRLASREAANEDAMARAEEQAALIGVGLGEELRSVDGVAAAGSSDFSPYAGVLPTGVGGCDPATDPSVSFGVGASVSVPAFDPVAPAEVAVYTEVAVTYAVDEDAAPPDVGSLPATPEATPAE